MFGFCPATTSRCPGPSLGWHQLETLPLSSFSLHRLFIFLPTFSVPPPIFFFLYTSSFFALRHFICHSSTTPLAGARIITEYL